MKSVIKRSLGAAGFEIRRRSAEIKPTEPIDAFLAEPPRDGVSGFPFADMANRAYRPAALRYHNIFGDDTRIKYVTRFLDVRDQRVLELGPYKGHWSIMLEKLGIRENVALEARQDNFDTCLAVKRAFQLDRTQFVRGDVEHIVAGEEDPPFEGDFDLVFCVGVFYHLTEPLPFLRWCMTQSSRLFLGTNVVYPEANATSVYTCDDKNYRCIYFDEAGGPLSGTSPQAVWLPESELVRMLSDAGYSQVEVLGHDIQSTRPHTAILAEK